MDGVGKNRRGIQIGKNMEHLFGKWLIDLPAAISDGISLAYGAVAAGPVADCRIARLAAYIFGGTAETGRIGDGMRRRLVREVLLKLTVSLLLRQGANAVSVRRFGKTFWTAARVLWASVCFKPIWKGRVRRLSSAVVIRRMRTVLCRAAFSVFPSRRGNAAD